jgi:hypothetical protein
MSMRRAQRTLSLFCLVLAVTLLTPQVSLGAPTHFVSADELHESIVNQSQKRQANLDKLERFLCIPEVKQRVEPILGDSEKIRTAMAVLSDEELDRLARLSLIERDHAAGALTNQQLTYIVIALATALFVLLIVVAAD